MAANNDTPSAVSPGSPDPTIATARAAPDQQAVAAVQAAEAKAIEAQSKAVDAAKSPEQRKADKALAEADDARAKAAEEAAAANAAPDRMTVAEARVMAPVPPDMGAGDHYAQQFTNDPENPHIARGEHADPEKADVRLSRVMPDHPQGVVTTVVHPEMAGDYLRAGWDRV